MPKPYWSGRITSCSSILKSTQVLEIVLARVDTKYTSIHQQKFKSFVSIQQEYVIYYAPSLTCKARIFVTSSTHRHSILKILFIVEITWKKTGVKSRGSFLDGSSFVVETTWKNGRHNLSRDFRQTRKSREVASLKLKIEYKSSDHFTSSIRETMLYNGCSLEQKPRTRHT